MSGICLFLPLTGSSSCLLQNESVRQRLIQAQQLWDSGEKSLNQMMLETVRMSQTLDYHSSPALSLQAHRDVHDRLQVGPLLPLEYVCSCVLVTTDWGVCCSFFIRRQKLRGRSGANWVKPSPPSETSSALLLPSSPSSWTDRETGETDTCLHTHTQTTHRRTYSQSFSCFSVGLQCPEILSSSSRGVRGSCRSGRSTPGWQHLSPNSCRRCRVTSQLLWAQRLETTTLWSRSLSRFKICRWGNKLRNLWGTRLTFKDAERRKHQIFFIKWLFHITFPYLFFLHTVHVIFFLSRVSWRGLTLCSLTWRGCWRLPRSWSATWTLQLPAWFSQRAGCCHVVSCSSATCWLGSWVSGRYNFMNEFACFGDQTYYILLIILEVMKYQTWGQCLI